MNFVNLEKRLMGIPRNSNVHLSRINSLFYSTQIDHQWITGTGTSPGEHIIKGNHTKQINTKILSNNI